MSDVALVAILSLAAVQYGMLALLIAGAVLPISRAPSRAGELISAAPMESTEPPFSLEQLMQAPVGRVDAFGVGVTPAETEPELEAAVP